MRPRTLLGAPAARPTAAALVLFAALALAAAAADKPAPKPAPAVPGDAKVAPLTGTAADPAPMTASTELMAPGPAHERLKFLAGNFKTSTKSMKDPKAPAATSAGTAVSTLIMGGRYVREELRGDLMGQPFEGLGLTGFDNAKKKYVTAWIDNMGTGILVAEGDGDASGEVLTQRTTYVDPATKTQKTARLVTRIVDADHKVFEWWDAGADGKEWMMMEVTYTRVK